MLMKSLFSAASTLALAAATSLPAIEISGNKFYYSNNGTQFLMKGVAYQQDTSDSTSSSFVDPLADYSACSRDIPYLQQLQTNVIRVYALNVSQDHTQCMNALAAAGIYVIADLSEPDLSINRESPVWNVELLERYTSVVDAFHNYTNVLGFFAGNEVTNNVTNTDASAYVKAAVRDTKAYIAEQGYRTIPVGYSANDDSDIRIDLAEYFACGNAAERADFFGLNMYEWCGSSTFTTSGYSTITAAYANLGIPLFFSEYGCNTVSPRKFTEVQAIYSSQMTNVWSGGIVYMYFQETNNYGLVSVSSGTVSTLADFTNLKSQLASVTPTYATLKSASASSATVTTCPTVGADWAAATVLPPTPDAGTCACMVNSLSCVASDSLDSSKYADIFAYVCGKVDCSGVTGNGTTGVYGAYSPCDAKDQLDFVLNLYYSANGKSSSACNFSGSASLKSATTASSCSAVLSSAGVSGRGSLTNAVSIATGSGTKTGTSTGTSNAASGSGSGSGAGSSSGATSTGTSTTSKSGSNVQYGFSPVNAAMLLSSFVVAGLGLVLV